MSKDYKTKKRYCSHCELNLRKNAKCNLCKICIELKRCEGCSILLRPKSIVKELKESRENYKYENNVSLVDKRFCIDCHSEYNLCKKVKKFCSCGERVTVESNKLDYFLKNGNFCKNCLEKVRFNLI